MSDLKAGEVAVNPRYQFAEEEKTFRDGSPNPQPCKDKPKTHKHYLFKC